MTDSHLRCPIVFHKIVHFHFFGRTSTYFLKFVFSSLWLLLLCRVIYWWLFTFRARLLISTKCVLIVCDWSLLFYHKIAYSTLDARPQASFLLIWFTAVYSYFNFLFRIWWQKSWMNMRSDRANFSILLLMDSCELSHTFCILHSSLSFEFIITYTIGKSWAFELRVHFFYSCSQLLTFILLILLSGMIGSLFNQFWQNKATFLRVINNLGKVL